MTTSIGRGFLAVNETMAQERDGQASNVQPLFYELLNDAVARGATDIHLMCDAKRGIVLFRIHGVVMPYKKYSVSVCEQLAGFLFTTLADSRSRSSPTFSLEMKSVTCMVPVTTKGHSYRLRYIFSRAFSGWDIAMRILRMERTALTLSQLGYAESQIVLLEEAVASTQGLIIFAGTTGSGKSTTLKALLDYDPHRHSKRRFSVEDPPEYEIRGVSQRSVQRDSFELGGGTVDFNGVLRDLLRSDPDDIMVGEIRDDVTAKLVADGVTTGHKIYSSLHTSSAMSVITRLAQLGVERSLLADAQFISALAFQKLLPVLCPDCKIHASSVLDDAEQAVLRHKFDLDVSGMYCAAEAGCAVCNGMGIVGQTVAAEVIIPDSTLQDFIAKGDERAAERYWRAQRVARFDAPDMTGKTSFEHALYKMWLGEVDPRDVVRTYMSFKSYQRVETPQ